MSKQLFEEMKEQADGFFKEADQFLHDLHNKPVVTDPLTYIMDRSEAVQDGRANALQTYIEIKRINEASAAALKEMQDQAIEEADRHPEKSFELYGAKIEKRAGGSRYSFKHIQEWQKKEQERKAIEEAAILAEKAQRSGQDIIKEGVIVEPAQFIEGKATIAISFK